MEAGGINATTSWQKRDNRGGGGGGGGGGTCDGDGKCCTAAIMGFGDDNYDNACQRPLRWGQLVPWMTETTLVVDADPVGSTRRTP